MEAPLLSTTETLLDGRPRRRMMHPRSELQIFAVLDNLCKVVSTQACFTALNLHTSISACALSTALLQGQLCDVNVVPRLMPFVAASLLLVLLNISSPVFVYNAIGWA